jgi:hypothetical protein
MKTKQNNPIYSQNFLTNHSTKSKAVTLCSIAGTSGACGPAGVNVQIDLTGGTGNVPPPSGPLGTAALTQLKTKDPSCAMLLN